MQDAERDARASQVWALVYAGALAQWVTPSATKQELHLWCARARFCADEAVANLPAVSPEKP